MNWNTIYIRGRKGFREEVNRRLDHSRLRVMPGSLGTSDDSAEMYWVSDHIVLKDFKKAIGARIIWKYRLTFYTSLEHFIESQYIGEDTADVVPEEDNAMPGFPGTA